MPERTATILVLEDDTVTRRLLEAALGTEGFAVESYGTLAHASAAVQRREFDLYLLDIMLPDGSGLDFCGMLRGRTRKPIVMLTVKGDTSDIVRGLEAGADDYILKPFQLPEIVARVRAQLRRAGPLSDQSTETSVRIGDLVIDRAARDAFVEGKRANLSPREFELLDYLAGRVGRSVTKEAVMGAIWGDEEDVSEKILAVYIHRLRCKIENDPEQPRFVQTVRGYGYMLAKEYQ